MGHSGVHAVVGLIAYTVGFYFIYKYLALQSVVMDTALMLAYVLPLVIALTVEGEQIRKRLAQGENIWRWWTLFDGLRDIATYMIGAGIGYLIVINLI